MYQKNILVIFSTLSIIAVPINGSAQAVDSTGTDRLIGFSNRVEAALPPAIPGPAGPAGPVGPTGSTGSPGSVPQGTMCGLVKLIDTLSSGGANGVGSTTTRLESSCQGFKIITISSDAYGRKILSNCPADYATYLISQASINNGQEGSTNSTSTTFTYSCLKI